MVRLEPAEASPSSWGRRALNATDSAGYFRFAEASAGDYLLVASRDGYAPSRTSLRVVEGADQEGLEVRLDPTEGIEVYVTLPSGEPAGEFWAAILDASGQPLVVESRASNGDGAARLNAPPGSWELLIGTYTSAVTSVQISVPSDPISIRLRDAAALKVRIPELEGDPTVASIAVTGVDGRPYRGIGWMQSRREPQIALGESHHLRIAPGTWTVRIEAPDGRVWQAQVSLSAGENPELVLR